MLILLGLCQCYLLYKDLLLMTVQILELNNSDDRIRNIEHSLNSFPWMFFLPTYDISKLFVFICSLNICCWCDLWTFRHFDVSPPGRFAPSRGRFAPWTVRHQDDSHPRRFATRTVRPLDVSPPGRFALWTIRHLDV